MTKTLQKRFIVTAMIAISVLLSFLLGAINIANYVMSNRQIEKIMTELTESGGVYHPPSFPGEMPPFQKFPFQEMPTPDDMMGARYFLVAFDDDGRVVHTDVNHIYAVSKEEAAEIAQKIHDRPETSGQYEHFKYVLVPGPDGKGSIALFLDIAMQQRTAWTVLLASCGGGLLCWIAMLLLVIQLSKRAIQPIAQNIEKQKQFVTNAGHEIKTPLAIILANTDAMELISGETKWSRNIRSQVIRLNGLMQNLLALAKMDEGGEKLPMSEFLVKPLLEEVLEQYREPAATKNIALQADIQPDVILRANRDSVMQMLSILLDNATKYTPDDGEISVCLKKEDKVVLQVKNTCSQPPEDDLEKLFDRFYRGDAARTQSSGGYGIGLSAARAIAEAHGGIIAASYESTQKTIVFTAKI